MKFYDSWWIFLIVLPFIYYLSSVFGSPVMFVTMTINFMIFIAGIVLMFIKARIEKYDILAPLSLLFSFIFAPIGLVLGIVGLSLRKQRTWWYWLAIAISLVQVLLIVLVIIFFWNFTLF